VSQRVLKLNDMQIVSGTERMAAGDGGSHTRLLWASVPPFASRPDVTVTIYSTEDNSAFYENGDVASSGETFVPWSIEYVPRSGVGGSDLLAVSAANTAIGAASDRVFVCSYLAVGEERKGERQ